MLFYFRELIANTIILLNCLVHLAVTARSPLEKTRYETSLGLLTKKFVSLFHSSSSGTVDLNKVIFGSLSCILQRKLSLAPGTERKVQDTNFGEAKSSVILC